MGALIKGVGTAIPKPALKRASSVDLAVRAANKSLSRAGIGPEKVGLLVFSGVYREGFIGEPALASFIQRRIKANPLGDGKHSTFSFDINEGARGLISGMELVDGFISAGEGKFGLAVTADVNPLPGQTINFPFHPGAAAVLLSRGGEETGFTDFATYDFPEYRESFQSTVSYMPNPGGSFLQRKRMGNVLRVKESEDLLKACLKSVREGLDQFCSRVDLKPGDFDLVIPSQYPKGLAVSIQKRTGFRKDSVIAIPDHYGNHHTSGPGFALRWALRKGMFDSSKKILFLGVGAGIAVGAALYFHPE
ncbi:MAG: 3-oxoacyl-[acyl-carrier-protein] synthase III C-terminal domain-containing protein [Thermoplasmatota archaeon]